MELQRPGETGTRGGCHPCGGLAELEEEEEEDVGEGGIHVSHQCVVPKARREGPVRCNTPDKPQLCTVVGGKQTGKVQAVQEGASHKDPGVAFSPKPLKPGAEVLCCSFHFSLSPKYCRRGRRARGHSCSPPWCRRTSGRREEHSARPAGPLRTRRRGPVPGA